MNELNTKHIPVLLNEATNIIGLEEGEIYVDATLGGGGHFSQVIEKNRTKTKKVTLIGIDQDLEAIKRVLARLDTQGIKMENKQQSVWEGEVNDIKIILINSNFENLIESLRLVSITRVNAVLADLGTSQDQLEDTSRGFSFLKQGPLDMRMGNTLQVTAADLLNALTRKELLELFRNLADLKMENYKLVNSIISYREAKPFESTTDLTKVINQAVPRSSIGSRTGTKQKRNLEARVFQALRIAVNHELYSLRQFLPQAFEALDAHGRLIVISFHSGEDRIVKHYFDAQVKENKAAYIEKLMQPGSSEVLGNPRSSSAKLRALQKL